MVNNAVRMLAFPAAIAGLILIGGIEGIVSGFLLAEWLAFLTGLTMTNRAQRRPLWHGVGRFLFFLTGSALLLLMVLFFGQSWWGALALTSAVILVWAIVLIRSDRKSTRLLQSIMRISYAVFGLNTKTSTYRRRKKVLRKYT